MTKRKENKQWLEDLKVVWAVYVEYKLKERYADRPYLKRG